MIEIALFEPEIPQNTGTILRLGACFGIRINLIMPFSFIFSDKKLKRAGMDYIDKTDYIIHNSYDDFLKYAHENSKRIIKLIPRLGVSYTKFQFHENDIIMGGRESCGFPDHINKDSNFAVNIPCKERSLNLAIATSIVTTEALRQVNYI